MKKQEKIDLIASCIGTSKIIRTYFKYDENYWYYYPNAANERFMLGQCQRRNELTQNRRSKMTEIAGRLSAEFLTAGSPERRTDCAGADAVFQAV